MKKLLILSFLAVAAATASYSQPLPDPHPGRLLLEMQKLETLGSVLYIAAHPDDENTQLLAWLANARHYRTGYLSLTRGRWWPKPAGQ